MVIGGNESSYIVSRKWQNERSNITRSQAVARIADRTAKNCKGHVT